MFHRLKTEEPKRDNNALSGREHGSAQPAMNATPLSERTPLDVFLRAQEKAAAESAVYSSRPVAVPAEPVATPVAVAAAMPARTAAVVPGPSNDREAKPFNTIEETKMSNETPQENSSETQQGQTRQIDIPAGVPAPASSYQTRPVQTVPGVRPATAYATTYPGAFQGTGSSVSVDKATEGRRLVISEGITMSGEIAACDHLVIEGTVEAALKGARVLDVTETGTFYGSVEIEEATIGGRFEGEIAVNGRLTIKGTGVVTGSISYKELQVEAGATIDGRISPLAKAGEKKTDGSRAVKKTAPKNDNLGGAELPFSGNAAAAE